MILSFGLIILPVQICGSRKPQTQVDPSLFKSIAIEDLEDVDLNKLAFNVARSRSASPRIPSNGSVQIGRFSVSHTSEEPRSTSPVMLRTPTPPTPRTPSHMLEYVDVRRPGSDDRLNQEHDDLMGKVVEEAFEALEKHRNLANAIVDRNQAAGIPLCLRDKAIYQQVAHSVKALDAYDAQDTNALEEILSSGVMSRDQQMHTLNLYADLLDIEEKIFKPKVVKILPMSVVRESPSYKSKFSTPDDSRSSSALSSNNRDQSPISVRSSSGRYSVFSPIQSVVPAISEIKRKGSMSNESVSSSFSVSVPSGRTPNND